MSYHPSSLIKRLAVLFAACVAMLCGTARAADWENWFDGGIGVDWPTNSAMHGGSWCEGAEARGRMLDSETLRITADEDEPLAFEATHSKPLGSDDAATNVTVRFCCAFQLFSISALPAVPAEAKGAVILVTASEEPEEASGGEFYYAAYDPDIGANAWKPSGLTAEVESFVDVSLLISRGVPGFIEVRYTIMGSDVGTFAVLQAERVVRDVVYVGSGLARGLSSEFKPVDPYRIGETEYADFSSMNAALVDGDTVVVQLNDTLPAGAVLTNQVDFHVGRYVLSTLSGQNLTIARDVAFTADSSDGLRFLAFFVRADYTLTLPSGTLLEAYSLSGEDFAYVVIDDAGWVRYDGQWRGMDLIAMYFYYPGYYDYVAETLYGCFGSPIPEGALDDFLESIDNEDFLQGYYWDVEMEMLIDYVYWFDGSWTWVRGSETTVSNQLPSHFVSGHFYPNSTAVVHRISYDMGEVDGATHANPTGYSIDTYFGLCGAVPPPDSELKFQCWTNASGRVVTEINPVALGRESGSLSNITLYASWGSESVEQDPFTVRPGVTAAFYDSSEQVATAVVDFNAKKARHILAPTDFKGSVTDYATNFEAVARGTALSVVLTESARSSLVKRISEDMGDVAGDLADPTVTKVTLKRAEPGFYYMILGGTDAGGIAKEGERKLAQQPTLDLLKPILGETDKAFFKIGAAVKP